MDGGKADNQARLTASALPSIAAATIEGSASLQMSGPPRVLEHPRRA